MSVYEITLKEGYKISNVKQIIDDIFLSITVLGTRIVFPYNVKNVFHLEIPHVSIQPLLFKEAIEGKENKNESMSLPIVVGRNVKDEIVIKDLVKIHHLLIAGRFGSGKGNAINNIIMSLIFNKTPEELKFVLIDTNAETFSVYNELDKAYFAVLKDNKNQTNNLVINDSEKAVQTLHALCEEMDVRYNKLKQNKCKHITEYIKKHERMPYIIVAIYEYADLMMYAGKDFELSLCRLAQLASAVGIHVIISTRMFRYNMITGSIKANFNSRWCFNTSARMDSESILDCTDAVSLNSVGDSIFAEDRSIFRVQPPHIREEEIKRIVQYVNNQTEGFESYLLPKLKTKK